MKRSPKLSIVIAIVLALCVAQGVAQAQTPRDLFQQALIQERAAGDLSKAIQLFQRAAKDAAGDRALAAEAFERAAMKLPIKTKVVARLGDTSHLGGE